MKYKIFTAAFVLLCLIPSAGMLFLPPTFWMTCLAISA